MLTLAIDTTAEFGSIALARGNNVLEEVLLHAPQGFSGILFAQLDALLLRHEIQIRDIDLFAGASGPGSFTGVRIGLAAIKGLAEVLGKPVAAISNLEALSKYGSAALRATVIDARRGEVFAAVFDAAGNRVLPESVLPFQRLLEKLDGLQIEWITTDFEPFRAAVGGTLFEHMPVATAPRALAGMIAQIAFARGGEDPVFTEANYVRRSDAELLWKG